MLRRTLVLCAVALIAATQGDNVWARGGRGSGHSGHSGHVGHSGQFSHGGHFHHHARVGVFVGVPVFAPLYYPPPPPYYYYPPAVVEPSYWYYCADSKAYYPYVQDCLGGWQQVVPQPPS